MSALSLIKRELRQKLVGCHILVIYRDEPEGHLVVRNTGMNVVGLRVGGTALLLSPLQAQLAATFVGKAVGGPGGLPDLFDDDVFNAGDFEQLGLDGFGVAAGAEGEEAESGAATMGHGHDDVDGVATDANVVHEAEVHDAYVGGVQLLVFAFAQGVPQGLFGDGAVAGLTGAGEACGGLGRCDVAWDFSRRKVERIGKAVAQCFQLRRAFGCSEGNGDVGILLVQHRTGGNDFLG